MRPCLYSVFVIMLYSNVIRLPRLLQKLMSLCAKRSAIYSQVAAVRIWILSDDSSDESARRREESRRQRRPPAGGLSAARDVLVFGDVEGGPVAIRSDSSNIGCT
jgi:hypothetical protein